MNIIRCLWAWLGRILNIGKKRIKCSVCQNRFAPTKESVYTVINLEEARIWFIPAMKSLDVIDCPCCGCQQRLAERLLRKAKEDK